MLTRAEQTCRGPYSCDMQDSGAGNERSDPGGCLHDDDDDDDDDDDIDNDDDDDDDDDDDAVVVVDASTVAGMIMTARSSRRSLHEAVKRRVLAQSVSACTGFMRLVL
jgi:hypothetical protein